MPRRHCEQGLPLDRNNFYPVILAGGRGTRFWPRSRRTMAKQILALEGKQTMIQQTVARLLPLAPASRFWVITNPDLHNEIRRQLGKLPERQIIAEPIARNTAPAIGLAAHILLRLDHQAVIGMFPADHVIAGQEIHREAEPGKGTRVRRSRQLLLEQRHVLLERANLGECPARALHRERAASGEDRRRLWHAR